jgi:thiaminase
LTAWTYAKQHLPTAPPTSPKEKALRLFVDNWTCEEFVGFVDDCRKVVDGLEIDPTSEIGRKAEEVFKRTIWLEQRFWPSL